MPYVAAIVDLDEGPRMMTRVVGAEFDDLRVGMPLEVTFEQETDEVTLPVFTPRLRTTPRTPSIADRRRFLPEHPPSRPAQTT